MGFVMLGGCGRRPSVAAVGSYGAMNGARMVMRTKNPTTTSPIESRNRRLMKPRLMKPARTGSRVSALVANTRVQTRVKDVDDQVDGRDEQGDEYDSALNSREVTVFDALQQVPRDTRPREHRLGEDRAAHQQRELQPDHRDDRDEGVAQGMLAHHHSLAQPLGPGRGHVLAAQDPEDNGPAPPA